MRYYWRFETSMSKHPITREKFYSWRRSKKWRERIWINGGKVVARELIMKES